MHLTRKRSAWRPAVSGFCLAILLSVPGLRAAGYFCDPDKGNMSNPGTSESPWSTLQAVFERGTAFAPGDVIYLRNGYHGSPEITGGPGSGNVIIQAQEGHTPALRRLGAKNARNWIVSGLNISQLNASEIDKVDNRTSVWGLVDLAPTSDHITVKNCTIYGAKSVVGWNASDFGPRMGTGVHVAGEHCIVEDNHIFNIRTGVWVKPTARFVAVRDNTIEDILNDGIFALADDGLYEYNLIRNWYGVNENHDDGIQSWASGGQTGIPIGDHEVDNCIFRGNTIINNSVGAGRLFPDDATHGVNGMGFFAGMFVNCVIENNLIIVDHVHGLTVQGATNCRIVNNTVIQNPYHPLNHIPIITIRHHPNHAGHPELLSSGNIIQNNLASDLPSGSDVWAAVGVLNYPNSSNVESRNYAAEFRNFPATNLNAGYDLHLKPTSRAVGIGFTSNAPTIDHDRAPRSEPYDAGAFESDSGTPTAAKIKP
ncbi:MAG: right-handed parallel beta-helix repeat-containing protein [Opitutaceae bacterium]|nr:right-handed parallel beta-helix repeat-containing protein [Opitutaceae bacterium]